MGKQAGGPITTWSAGGSPISIEWRTRLMEDIRLAVLEAFYSIPRGGVEIGGVLLGAFEGDHVRISGRRPVACEYASGPSFELSERDRCKMGQIVNESRCASPGAQVVGWYHSRTRGGDLISAGDLEIHRAYFPEIWQFALVLSPSASGSTTARFFFPDAGGSLTEAQGGELILRPVGPRPPVETVTGDAGASQEERRGSRGRTGLSQAPASALPSSSQSEVPAFWENEPMPAPLKSSAMPDAVAQPVIAPSFLTDASPARTGLIARIAVISVALAGAAGLFQTREHWQASLVGFVRATPQPQESPRLGLNVLDLAGQLQIRWNPNSPALSGVATAQLEIVDSATPLLIELDAPHLNTGVFTFSRQSARVDVTLRARRIDGREVIEATTFLSGSASDRFLYNPRPDRPR